MFFYLKSLYLNFTCMKMRNILVLILFLNLSHLYSQAQEITKPSIKNGTFYFYPKNSKNRFCIIRMDSLQKEINLTTNDTSFWRINWQNDSSVSARFLRSTNKMPDGEVSFFKTHVVVMRIKNISSLYYTFSGGLDSFENLGDKKDTAWLSPKTIAN